MASSPIGNLDAFASLSYRVRLSFDSHATDLAAAMRSKRAFVIVCLSALPLALGDTSSSDRVPQASETEQHVYWYIATVCNAFAVTALGMLIREYFLNPQLRSRAMLPFVLEVRMACNNCDSQC